METALEEIRKRTRHYAKRQITFLKRMEGILYVDGEAREAYAQIEGIFRI